MQPVAISERTLHILETLEPGQSLEKKVEKLAEQELLRRLARYQLTDYSFRKRYGLTLEEFEAEGVVQKRGYSFDVECDHQDWDLAVDGIETIERQLSLLRGAAIDA
ncbi:MAG: hypothetical protein DWI57_09045 [Chloroflexi bacterium]|nr:MAG: hypothetical protein DWI57_09045 [Chloroflexota bacterium]